MLEMSHQRWRWLARCIFALAIVVISALAFSSHPPEITTRISDKANHLMAFFVLAVALDQTAARLSLLRGIVLPLLAYGMVIELVQGQLGYREMSLLDVAADSTGIALYSAAREWMRRLVLKVVTLT